MQTWSSSSVWDSTGIGLEESYRTYKNPEQLDCSWKLKLWNWEYDWQSSTVNVGQTIDAYCYRMVWRLKPVYKKTPYSPNLALRKSSLPIAKTDIYKVSFILQTINRMHSATLAFHHVLPIVLFSLTLYRAWSRDSSSESSTDLLCLQECEGKPSKNTPTHLSYEHITKFSLTVRSEHQYLMLIKTHGIILILRNNS